MPRARLGGAVWIQRQLCEPHSQPDIESLSLIPQNMTEPQENRQTVIKVALLGIRGRIKRGKEARMCWQAGGIFKGRFEW